MTSFDELAAIQAGRKSHNRTVDVEFGGELLTLRFEEIRGDLWAGITARNPMREDAPLDVQCGYNVLTASREAAILSGVRVVDDETETLTPEQWATLLGAPSTGEVPEVLPALVGNDYRRTIDAIWLVNEYDPIGRRDALKKASMPAGPSRRKRS